MAPPRKSPRVAAAAAAAASEPDKTKKTTIGVRASPVKKATKKGRPAAKKATPTKEKKVAVDEVKNEESAGSDTTGKDKSYKKTIVVEYCKQCNQFKIRAIKVKDALEKAFPSINVLLNPEKPRRGCFEVREEGGEIFISLLDMKRPFTKMKELDMDEVVADIVKKIDEA